MSEENLFSAEGIIEKELPIISFAAPFIEIFYKEMLKKGYSYTELAARSGESKQTVVRFFKPESKNPSAETTKNIAQALGISLDEVFGLKEPEQKLDPNIEVIINAHAEIIKEKDARIAEMEETIRQIRLDKVQRQKKQILNNTLLLLFAAAALFLFLFALVNGDFGSIRH